jgi:hypothetical protein
MEQKSLTNHLLSGWMDECMEGCMKPFPIICCQDEWMDEWMDIDQPLLPNHSLPGE